MHPRHDAGAPDPGPPAGCDEAGFRARIAEALGITVEALWPGGTPLGRATGDEVALFDIVAAVEGINPSFRVPDQLDLRDATLDDLYHFCSVMRREHLEADDR
jgi:hypothetical protein